jgi:16S rRNA (guanine527-N7)-methyltransferase
LRCLAAEGVVDNTPDAAMLQQGAAALGERLTEEAVARLLWFRAELLRWNARVNLTAITDPREVLEKHLLDSLAILPEVRGASALLDLGAGAGLPGIPLKIALPELRLTLVDSVGKKVAFMKSALAHLGLREARALQARVEGRPEREGVEPADVVVSRALMDVARWLPLGAKYLAPGGRVLAMMGQPPALAEIEEAGRGAGLKLSALRRYRLPWSGSERAVGTFTAA